MTEGTGELLSNTFFQMAYVTNDIEEAVKRMKALYGLKNFLWVPEVTVSFGHGRAAITEVALAYAGDTQIEIIRHLGGSEKLYQEGLGGSGFQLAFHHEGQLVSNREIFEKIKATWRMRDFSFALEGENKILHYCYVDTRAILGHYVEYAWFTPDDGESLLASIRAATHTEGGTMPIFSVQ
jgi:Glyoxalase/Bleomycin resistance protein/Dioxygenase superfamily